MNPDNPYAAPQTISRPAVSLATSADADRLDFGERSIVRLRELLDYSYAIQQMHVIWILLAVLATCFTLLVVVTSVEYADASIEMLVALGITALIYTRVAAGYSRGLLCRACGLLCDGLLTVGLLWLIVILVQDDSLPTALLCAFIGLHAASSFVAHCHARELFRPLALKQADLAGEITYRRLHGID